LRVRDTRPKNAKWRISETQRHAVESAKSLICLLVLGVIQRIHNYREWLVADAVTVEPVSSKQFPGNREKYREVD
jgi:hypothetical protein